MDNNTLQGKLEQLRNGDKEALALADIYEALKLPVHTIAFRILYDRALSEDVVQDVFVKLYQAPPAPHIRNPRAWIFQMTHNLAIDYKRKPTTDSLDEQILHGGSSVAEMVEMQVDLESAMQALEDEERMIVSLHLTADLKFRVIAEMMNKPLGTILWKYRKTITKLQKRVNGGAT